MKKRSLLTLVAMVLILLMLCTGCESVLQNFDNSQVHAKTEAMLDALIGDDFQSAYALVSQVCTEAEFSPAYAQMRQFLGDTKAYDLTLYNIQSNFHMENGQQVSTVEAQYLMTIPSGKVIVSVKTTGAEYVLNSFRLTPYEKTDYYVTGTVENMNGANVLQWFLLLTNLVSIGAVVYAIVDCARNPIKNKALWILILIFGFLTIGVTVSASRFHMNFNLGSVLAYTAMIVFGSGTMQIRLMVPVGAAIYFIRRKAFLRQSAPPPAPEEILPEAEPAEDSEPAPQTEELPPEATAE